MCVMEINLFSSAIDITVSRVTASTIKFLTLEHNFTSKSTGKHCRTVSLSRSAIGFNKAHSLSVDTHHLVIFNSLFGNYERVSPNLSSEDFTVTFLEIRKTGSFKVFSRFEAVHRGRTSVLFLILISRLHYEDFAEKTLFLKSFFFVFHQHFDGFLKNVKRTLLKRFTNIKYNCHLLFPPLNYDALPGSAIVYISVALVLYTTTNLAPDGTSSATI